MMTIEQLYNNYLLHTKAGADARALLMQTHWYSSIAVFDPRTGEALPQTLVDVLNKNARFDASTADATPRASSEVQGKYIKRDRLWRITEHARESLKKLYHNLNESPQREHAILPLRSVRELDTASFMTLSRRPGRNIREKLAGKPYLQAVRRIQSFDLPENRLLKAFSERLLELLELRVKCLNEEPDELLPIIQSWLVSDDAKTIGRWENLTPNNTLLSHRHYRAVYDSWRWLQSLNDDITRDFEKLGRRQKTMDDWRDGGKMYASGVYVFAEMPVLFDYDSFEISFWTEKLASIKREKPKHQPSLNIATPTLSACVDLTELYPRYAVCENESGVPKSKVGDKLPYPFIWQCWQRNEPIEQVNITLFQSEVAYLHSDATTVSAPDLFFSHHHSAWHLDLAARAFAEKLRDVFKTDSLFWLLPDYLNDFELEITRRNLNASFPDATPLPRSIAALFEDIDYDMVQNGFSVVVLDAIGGKQCATKIEARYDEELHKKVPETKGYYWERHPTVVLSDDEGSSDKTQGNTQGGLDIVTVDADGKWHAPSKAAKPIFFTREQLLDDKRVGPFSELIILTNSPVRGGNRLYALQKKAGNIALWRDQIPELSIKVKSNGRYKYFKIVTRGTTVRPIRGHAKQIDVKETFTLPHGKSYYSLPLCIGENDDEIGFAARLESPYFPLKRDLECRLNLTFTYGVDDAYCLIFEPIDKSIPPILVKWKREDEEIVTDAPAPDYPRSMSWDELQRYPKNDGSETTDLLDWASEFVNFKFYDERKSGIITKWKTDDKGFIYTTISCAGQNIDTRISAYSFADGVDCSRFGVGSSVSFVLEVKESTKTRQTGTIVSDWMTDYNGSNYILVRCRGINFNLKVFENRFANDVRPSDFKKGDLVSFELVEHNGKKICYKVASLDYKEKLYFVSRIANSEYNATYAAIKMIHKSFYFPLIQIWRDGRSVSDGQCPMAFRKTTNDIIKYLLQCLSQNGVPEEIKDEIMCLMSFMHKDAPEECVRWLEGLVEQGKLYRKQVIGFALGDVTTGWQQRLMKKLIDTQDNYSLRVFAYAIWREQHFVERFTLEEYQSILVRLQAMLENVKKFQPRDNDKNSKNGKMKWIRSIAEPLELLLGLLRTRASRDEDIKMLLQPHQKITRELAKQVERITDIVADSNVKLLSRVQINNLPPKPKGDNTPDLLYALRLYLTGDDGANAIQVTGVDDSDEE